MSDHLHTHTVELAELLVRTISRIKSLEAKVESQFANPPEFEEPQECAACGDNTQTFSPSFRVP
jgi:hypothetical protein